MFSDARLFCLLVPNFWWVILLLIVCTGLDLRATSLLEVDFAISSNPWAPSLALVSWVVLLYGGWIFTPQVLLAQPGAAVQYGSAFVTRRLVFATPSFQKDCKELWWVLLRLAKRTRSEQKPMNWKLITSAQEWAVEEAKRVACTNPRPWEVLSSVLPPPPFETKSQKNIPA